MTASGTCLSTPAGKMRSYKEGSRYEIKTAESHKVTHKYLKKLTKIKAFSGINSVGKFIYSPF